MAVLQRKVSAPAKHADSWDQCGFSVAGASFSKDAKFRACLMKSIALLEEVLDDLESRIEESGASVQIAPLPQIEGDRTQIYQLFLNLIGNALKYHKENESPRVQIAAVFPEEAWVEIRGSGRGHWL